MSGPPSAALRLLRLLTKGKRRIEVEGDLLEGYEEWARTLGPARARLRVWREVALLLTWRLAGRVRLRRRSPGSPRTGSISPKRRDDWRGYVSDLSHDLGFASRRLSRSPGATLVAILILGAGVGGNATIFSIADALFREPPALVSSPHELVGLHAEYDEFGYYDFLYYREHGGAFRDLMAYGGLPGTQGRTPKSGGEVAVGRGDDLTQAQGWVVSANYFHFLGVPPLHGAGFSGRVGQSQAAQPEVVLSHGFWRRQFGGDPRVTGNPLYVNGVPFRIVGITPEEFRGINPTDRLPDLFIPIMAMGALIPDYEAGLRRYSPSGEPQGGRDLRLVGRLKPGMGWDAAEAEMASLQQRWEREFAEWADAVYGGPYQVRIRPEFRLTRGEARTMKRMLSFLWFVVGSVFLIACTNLALLMLARAAGREREMGIRASLGAGRGRFIRQLLAESLILAGLGGGLGVLVAFVATDAATEMLPATIAFDLNPDASVVGFSLLLSTLAALLFGTAPAWILSGVNVAQALGRTGQGRTRALFRGGLVAVQSAISVILLIVGGLFARSLQEARAVPLGFETENRILLSIRLDNHGYSDEEGMAFLTAARDRMAGVPGVRAVTAANRMPFQPRNHWDFVVPGTEYAEVGLYAGLNMVGADYLEVMGIPLVAGRSIGEADGPGTPWVVVVNRLFADRMWPGQNPLGRTITFAMEGEWRVVGVAENSTYWWLGEDPVPFVYFPLRQLFTGRMTFHVATLSRPMEVAREVERAMRDVDPNLAIAVSTVEARLDQQLASLRIWTAFVALFSLVALFLSMVGLYGVQSYLDGLLRAVAAQAYGGVAAAPTANAPPPGRPAQEGGRRPRFRLAPAGSWSRGP